MHGRISEAVTVIMIMVLLITGCTSQAFNIGMAKDKENNAVDIGFNVSTVGSYDSADTAVVMAVDQENSCVIFMNMDTGRQYTLYYDGTTYVTDKYDGPMTISQIRAGDIVDVNFLKGKRQIANIKVSPSAWIYENIENYDLGGINKTANIGSNTYQLPDEAVVLSEGKRVEVMDVVAQDRVTIRGIDHKIYSINVERGHGYLRLRNEQALLGGWIEVGNSVIKEIKEDMLLVVPEGSYQVSLSNEGISSTKDVVIERDKETVLDVGDIEIVRNKVGKILFSVTPSDAKVTIDGESADISKAVELPYGIHQIHLEAEGYDSLTKYIQVGSEYAKIAFTLEEKKEEETPTVSDNTLDVKDPVQTSPEPSISENTITPTQSNKVYIDSPKNVEVYVDSNYIGIAPVSFKKTVGSHTVTLRKSGYKTKSYTIYLYNDGEDITYSFVDLEKEGETVSGNGISSTSSTSSKNPSSSGSTENPSSSGSTENPSSSGSTENPSSSGSTENPSSSGSTENPSSSGSTENPSSSGSTENPSSSGSTENPSSSGSTENSSGGSTENSSGGSTENSSGGSTENSSGGSTENSSGGSTENSSGGSTENSSKDSTVTDPDEGSETNLNNMNSIIKSGNSKTGANSMPGRKKKA